MAKLMKGKLMVDLNSFADKESFFEEQFVVSIQTSEKY